MWKLPFLGWRSCWWWAVLWNQLEWTLSAAGLGGAGIALHCQTPALTGLRRHCLVIIALLLFCLCNEFHSLHFKTKQAEPCLANNLMCTLIFFFFWTSWWNLVGHFRPKICCFNFIKSKQKPHAYVQDLARFHVISFSYETPNFISLFHYQKWTGWSVCWCCEQCVSGQWL